MAGTASAPVGRHDLFERELSVATEEIELQLRGLSAVSWADFLLNPRRLRGSDFLMRWSQGVWSEERVVQAINETGRYWALPYGPSGTAPDDDIRAHELYFDRLERAGLGRLKRPDLLIFSASDKGLVEDAVAGLGGRQELPFTPEEHPTMRELLSRAVLAVECENSLWRARQMPHYGSELKPMKRLGGKLGLSKSAVLPTLILKEEDRTPIREWQNEKPMEVHVWHLFYDMAFGLSFDRAEQLIASGAIQPTEQVLQAPGGATSRKIIYKVYYHYAYRLGDTVSEPQLVADCITDSNGHILPYVRFEGGKLVLHPEALDVLARAHTRHTEGKQ